MKAAKLGLRWFQAVLKRISWVSLLTGLAVGVPLWWTVKAITGSGHMGPGVELAVGVALGALGGWAVPEFVDYVRRLTKTSRPLTQVIGELASNSTQTMIVMLSFRKIRVCSLSDHLDFQEMLCKSCRSIVCPGPM